MRLWHRDLIKCLPKQQLLGQWRELCCIASNLANDHTPNHLLVNPITDYPPEHFEAYCNLVIKEMKKRGMNIQEASIHKIQADVRAWRIYLNNQLPWDLIDWDTDIGEPIYFDWHNDRYLNQCYYNLEEKFDRGGIPEEEWNIIFATYGRYI